MAVDRFSIGEPEDYVLFVGQIVRHKRVEVAIEAARMAGRPIKVVGDGPELPHLRARYPDPAVEFLGSVGDDRLADLYARCVALVVPNIEEFGIAAVEAQAAGRPVVAVGRGGARETVLDGRTGVLVDDEDAASLAAPLRDEDFGRFDPVAIREHAQGFSAAAFRERFKSLVERYADQHEAFALSGPVLVTGGAGYVGAPVVETLLDAGREVRVLDSLLHRQQDVADDLAARGADVRIADIGDVTSRRTAVAGVDAVVHLAAIVGDPACARDPELARAINVEATKGLIDDADGAGVGHLIFASTCSNYGRMADPEVPVDEDAPLAPVSLYAEQKVEIEKLLLGDGSGPLNATCLRFATVYGVAPRMRFDLTVNEFTRELWADRDLEVFGEQFWRPYVHVRDAARAIVTALEAGPEEVGGDVFNVGDSDENYRKLDLVEIITAQISTGRVSYVHRDEDPRDYKVVLREGPRAARL